MLNYFENTKKDIHSFWEPVPIEVDEYPHAPWWGYEPVGRSKHNPGAIIASAFILFGSEKQKEIVFSITKECLAQLVADEESDDHDCYSLIALFDKLLSLNSTLITGEHIAALKRKISNSVCYDENKWNSYVAQPFDFAYSSDSLWYDCVKDGIEYNFNYWINNLKEEGVWQPHFSWGIDSDASRQATINWTGFLATRRIKIFKVMG